MSGCGGARRQCSLRSHHGSPWGGTAGREGESNALEGAVQVVEGQLEGLAGYCAATYCSTCVHFKVAPSNCSYLWPTGSLPWSPHLSWPHCMIAIRGRPFSGPIGTAVKSTASPGRPLDPPRNRGQYKLHTSRGLWRAAALAAAAQARKRCSRWRGCQSCSGTGVLDKVGDLHAAVAAQTAARTMGYRHGTPPGRGRNQAGAQQPYDAAKPSSRRIAPCCAHMAHQVPPQGQGSPLARHSRLPSILHTINRVA